MKKRQSTDRRLYDKGYLQGYLQGYREHGADGGAAIIPDDLMVAD